MRGWRAWLVGTIAGAALFAAACGGGGTNERSSRDVSDGGERTVAAERSWAGKDAAPAFPGGLEWFNVQKPPALGDLKGKVVVLDFWTLGCINCQHVIPDLKRLEAEFGGALVVIGVHSGKYATEHDGDSIREAIERYGLEHPVVNDPDFVFWRAYGATAWPTLIIIDPAGKAVGSHAGEGVYPLFQPIIASLLKEFGAKGQLDEKPYPVAKSARVAQTVLSYPAKPLADQASGRLFIADAGHNRVVEATLAGELKRAIGSGVEGFADGGAAEARFRQPQGLALSPDGATLYVADTRNHAVRAVALATGEVTTIAGTGKQLDRLPAAGAKGTATALASPWDVAIVGRTLYISMAGVHQVWALDLETNAIAVFAGTSREGITDGDRRTMATLAQPSGIATDGTNLFWVDPESSSVRTVPVGGDGKVETLVGTGLFDYGDEDGIGKRAKLQHAQGIALGAGGLFVADTYNHKVKAVALAGAAVRTLAGGERGRADGDGGAARFDEPGGLSEAGGKLYVADTNNHVIRLVDLRDESVSTLALSNAGVLRSALSTNAVKVTLNPATAAPGASTLRVTIETPSGHKLNSLAPGRLELLSADTRVAEPGERTLTWSSDGASVSFPVPLELRPGSTTLTAAGSVYFCREGEEALCYIHEVELTLPLTVVEGSTNGEVPLVYVLPRSDS